MAADESNATHRMKLTFLIKDNLAEQTHEYLFRVLDMPGDLGAELSAELPEIAAYGGGGGYRLNIHPFPSSVFSSNHVSFEVIFNRVQNGNKTTIEEKVDVPLFEDTTGQVGLVQYRTQWKADPEN